MREHVRDASSFELGTMACDDNGDGYVNFTTTLELTAARDSFMADRVCPPSSKGAGNVAVYGQRR